MIHGRIYVHADTRSVLVLLLLLYESSTSTLRMDAFVSDDLRKVKEILINILVSLTRLYFVYITRSKDSYGKNIFDN